MTDTTTQTNSKAEYRRMTPQEVAVVIRTFRAALKLTQEGLAERAPVELRTLQRAEAGQKVSDAMLRRIAAGLGLKEEVFTDVLEIPTLEEFERLAEEERKKYVTIAAQELTTGDDLVGFLGGLHGIYPGHEPVDKEELRQLIAGFFDEISEIMLILGDLSHRDRLGVADNLSPTVKQLQSAGLHLVSGRHKAVVKASEGQPMEWIVGHLHLLRKVPTELTIRRDLKVSF